MNRLLAAAVLAVSPALPASAAPAAVPAPAAPVVVNPAIIPLPLQPVVPAAQRACTTKTASGLGYAVLRAADGRTPGATDFVLVNYIGYLAASGQVFDQGMQTPMQVSGVIPGFGEGLQLLPRGAIYRFCIPAAIGYGANATGPIPANADLLFQVELVDSKTAAEVEAIRKSTPAGQPAQPANPSPSAPPTPKPKP